ncbi:MAG: translesion error-prone DNA polymerase V autoproteolytic subunit [Alcaligenaceae bacterium]|nr:translesion error-prone DNA polymerase V autoproteolytic subunit [Alcaligenaceae bacterium]
MKLSLLGQSLSSELLVTVSKHLPLFLERVPAGFPSPAQDYIEQSLDLNELCINHPEATYFVRCEGDSMIEAAIHSGDILVVDRSLSAAHGDIVIASLYGELTVKELRLRPKPGLFPRNRHYQPIILRDTEALEIFGVVTYVLHALRRGHV